MQRIKIKINFSDKQFASLCHDHQDDPFTTISLEIVSLFYRSSTSSEEEKNGRGKKVGFLSSGISRCAHGRRFIGNVMLILRGTACRTVGAFQESLASPAALTMIRPAARRWRRYRAARIYRGDRPIYHIPIPPRTFLVLFTSLRSTLPRLRLFTQGPRSLASVTVALRTTSM